MAAWAASLGAEARFVGGAATIAAGELVTRALAERGVEIVGPAGGRTGVVVSIAAAGDRTMASDRGVCPELAPHDLDASWFDCDVLHLSGYSLLREPIASAAVAAAALRARARRADLARRLDVVARRRRRSASAFERSRPTSSSRTKPSATRSATLETRGS